MVKMEGRVRSKAGKETGEGRESGPAVGNY